MKARLNLRLHSHLNITSSPRFSADFTDYVFVRRQDLGCSFLLPATD